MGTPTPSVSSTNHPIPPSGEESKGRGPCIHCTKEKYELVLSGIQASSKKHPRCHSCRRKRRRSGKWKPPNKGGKAGPQSNPIWVCLDCNLYSCGGVKSESVPFGHARSHAMRDKHPCAVRFNNPLVRWCFMCNSSLPMKSVEGMETEVNADAPDDKQVYRVMGLRNNGNTCFFNSILQNLLAMDILREKIISLSPPEGSLISNLQYFFIQVQFQEASASKLDPDFLFTSLCEVAPHFGDRQQHDSHEVLRCFLNGFSSVRTSTDQHMGARIIDDIFGGQFSSTVTCVECRHASTVYEPFLDLSLSLSRTIRPSNNLRNDCPSEEYQHRHFRFTYEDDKSDQVEDAPQPPEDDGSASTARRSEDKDRHSLVLQSGPPSLDTITISQIREASKGQTVHSPTKSHEAKSPSGQTSMSSVTSYFKPVKDTGHVKPIRNTGEVKEAGAINFDQNEIEDLTGPISIETCLARNTGEVEDAGPINFDHNLVEDLSGPISIETCLALFTERELLPDEHGWHCERCFDLVDCTDSKASEDKEVSSTSKNLGSDVKEALGHLNENASVVKEALGNNKKSESLVQAHDDEHLQKDEEIAESSHEASNFPENSGNEIVPCRTNNVKSVGCNGDKVSDEKGEKKQTKNGKVKRAATKRILIKKAPHILTLHLKRFTQESPGLWMKLGGHVDFQGILDLEKYMDPSSEEKETCLYHLIGVVEHLGSMHEGHYVAYVRGGDGGEGGERAWFRASDIHVKEVPLSEVLECEAYILFYERVQ